MWEGAHAHHRVGRGWRVEGWEGVRGVGGHETSLGGGQERGGRQVGGKDAKVASGVQDGDTVATRVEALRRPRRVGEPGEVLANRAGLLRR